MKEIKTWSLAFTYVGCFLGAGFISGQELWQFFGSFGNLGYVGFLLAVVLFSAIGILFVRLTQMTQCSDMDRLLVPWNVKWLRAASGAVGAVFLFFVVVSMSAGVGAMLAQLFGISAWLGTGVRGGAAGRDGNGQCLLRTDTRADHGHRGLRRGSLRHLRHGGGLPAAEREQQPADAQLVHRSADLRLL